MKKKFLLITIFVIISVLCFTYSIGNIALAETENETTDNDISTRGLAVSISLSIDGGNGNVWAKAKNEFTLFPSTVEVYVELYSSTTYQESYTTMTLVSMNHISDLDMGHSLQAIASTNGTQLYWQARVRYKLDNNSWKSKTTSTFLFNAQGNYIS